MSAENKGNWFAVSHGITSPELKLSANARVLLIALLACENRFAEDKGGRFFTFNEQLQSMCGFGSEDTLKRAKKELRNGGYISTAKEQRTISEHISKTTMYYQINHRALESKQIYENKFENGVPFEDEELPF